MLPRAPLPATRVIENHHSNPYRSMTHDLPSGWMLRRAEDEEEIQRRAECLFSITPLPGVSPGDGVRMGGADGVRLPVLPSESGESCMVRLLRPPIGSRRYCAPRHRMPSNSRNEGRKCVG